MTAVPDYVPMLIKGVSSDPKNGGCVVQIANWLERPDVWSDDPICVNDVLAEKAIWINDAVDDEHRRQVALLAPRLSGTRIPHICPTDAVRLPSLSARNVLGAEECSACLTAEALYVWMGTNRAPFVFVPGAKPDTTKYKAGDLVWHLTPPRLQFTGTQQDAIDWLTAFIDEYDRVTGRTSEPLPVEKWQEIRELLGQK